MCVIILYQLFIRRTAILTVNLESTRYIQYDKNSKTCAYKYIYNIQKWICKLELSGTLEVKSLVQYLLLLTQTSFLVLGFVTQIRGVQYLK
jgi:hypothetical protein